MLQSYSKQITNANQREATTYVIVAYTDLYQGAAIMEKDCLRSKFQRSTSTSRVAVNPDCSIQSMLWVVSHGAYLANEFIREERPDPNRAGLNALIQYAPLAWVSTAVPRWVSFWSRELRGHVGHARTAGGTTKQASRNLHDASTGIIGLGTYTVAWAPKTENERETWPL